MVIVVMEGGCPEKSQRYRKGPQSEYSTLPGPSDPERSKPGEIAKNHFSALQMPANALQGPSAGRCPYSGI